MGTKNEAAWSLIAEALELHGQGSRKEALWTDLKDPMIERVKEAVALAPEEADVLFMATWLLNPLSAAWAEPKRLIGDYQRRLDQLGGPSDEVLEMVGGKEVYRRHRAMVKESAGSGCLVSVAQAVLVLTLIAAAVAL